MSIIPYTSIVIDFSNGDLIDLPSIGEVSPYMGTPKELDDYKTFHDWIVNADPSVFTEHSIEKLIDEKYPLMVSHPRGPSIVNSANSHVFQNVDSTKDSGRIAFALSCIHMNTRGLGWDHTLMKLLAGMIMYFASVCIPIDTLSKDKYIIKNKAKVWDRLRVDFCNFIGREIKVPDLNEFQTHLQTVARRMFEDDLFVPGGDSYISLLDLTKEVKKFDNPGHVIGGKSLIRNTTIAHVIMACMWKGTRMYHTDGEIFIFIQVTDALAKLQMEAYDINLYLH